MQQEAYGLLLVFCCAVQKADGMYGKALCLTKEL